MAAVVLVALAAAPLALADGPGSAPGHAGAPPLVRFGGECEYRVEAAASGEAGARVHTVRCEERAGANPPPAGALAAPACRALHEAAATENGSAPLRAACPPPKPRHEPPVTLTQAAPGEEPRPVPPGGAISLSKGGLLAVHSRHPGNVTVVALRDDAVVASLHGLAGPGGPLQVNAGRLAEVHGPYDTLLVKVRFPDGPGVRLAYAVGP